MPSLILYSGASYTGSSLLVTHGQTGELASATALDYLSVGVDDMQAFCWSAVSTTQATDYQYHTESLISANIASLASLYPPEQTQYPMSYLGIDPAMAAPVWLDMSQVSGDINALAATSLVGGSTTSMTTLSRTGVDGMLAFIGLAGGSSVVATCSYGSYDEASGQVDWTAPNAGTLVLEYTGGAVVVLAATGFPDGWTFGAPKVQPDGSWRLAVSGVVAGNVISSLSASKETLMNDGTDTVTLTATVTDGTTGRPVSGVSVNWHAALGNLSADTSVTDASGQATARLTDSGDTGAIVVTASLDDGSQRDITLTLTDAAAGQTLVSLTSDKDSIENDGTDTATLIATVHNADGSVAEGVAVTWQTTLGHLNHKKQDTNSGGVSKAKLTDSGDTGPATVTASLANGSQKTVEVAVVAGYMIVGLTSDRRSMDAGNTSDYTVVYATVENGSGQPVPGVTVTWTEPAGEIQVISGTSVTNSDGVASTRIQPYGNSAAGTYYVHATLDNGSTDKIEIDLAVYSLNMYCSTSAPLNTGALASVVPTNKVAVYGWANAVVQLSVSGSAKFLSSGTASASLTLGTDGYGLAEISDTVGETVAVSAVSGSKLLSGTMTFLGAMPDSAIYINDLTPADNRTPCSYYWWDFHSYRSTQAQITLTGNAHFEDGTQSGIFPLNTQHAMKADIFDMTTESVAITGHADGGYTTKTLHVQFVEVSD